MLGTTASWRQGQFSKLGDWRQVEALDRPAIPEGDESRALARNYIRRYWPLIRTAWATMQAGSEIVCFERRPRHELSDCPLSEKQVRKVLQAIW